jgi:PHAX RNA-binding domain
MYYHLHFRRRKRTFSENESNSSNGSFQSSKPAKKRNKRKQGLPKILPEMSASLDSTEEEFGQDLAIKLEEENVELMIKTVAVIGKEASLNFFKKTQHMELKGGMMTMNNFRRRTPGGLFLFLIKTANNIDESLKSEIFESGKMKFGTRIAVRKMSNEQSETKDPPNSPENPEFIESNVKITDPDLVSQKILNISKPEASSAAVSDDALELDYNYDEMDTF